MRGFGDRFGCLGVRSVDSKRRGPKEKPRRMPRQQSGDPKKITPGGQKTADGSPKSDRDSRSGWPKLDRDFDRDPEAGFFFKGGTPGKTAPGTQVRICQSASLPRVLCATPALAPLSSLCTKADSASASQPRKPRKPRKRAQGEKRRIQKRKPKPCERMQHTKKGAISVRPATTWQGFEPKPAGSTST